MAEINLEQIELDWLESRGGRTRRDVEIDEDGRKYIWMQKGRDEEKMFFIPSIEALIRERNNQLEINKRKSDARYNHTRRITRSKHVHKSSKFK